MFGVRTQKKATFDNHIIEQHLYTVVAEPVVFFCWPALAAFSVVVCGIGDFEEVEGVLR